MAKAKKEPRAKVIERMARANIAAVEIFGTQADAFAEQEIYEYFEVADEDKFLSDLREVVAEAKIAYPKTVTPTPEQVFYLFDAIYNND